MATGNSKFPGLDQKYVMEIEQRTANVPAGAKEMLQQRMYSDFYAQQKREEEQAERLAMKNEMVKKEIDAKSGSETGARLQIKKGNLADAIRNFYKLTISDGDDDTLVSKFTNGIKNGNKMYIDYLNGDNNDIMIQTGLLGDAAIKLNNIAQQNKVEIKGNVSNAVVDNIQKQQKQQGQQTQLTSTSKFDDSEYANNYLKEQDSSYSDFIKQAKDKGYPEWQIASIIDASKQYQQYLDNLQKYEDRSLGEKIGVGGELPLGVAQGFTNFFINSYNNLLGENPYVGAFNPINQFDAAKGLATDYDPTGEMRANSWRTKGGDLAGKIGAAILTDQALLKLLPGMQAENLTSEGIKEIAKEGGKDAVKEALLSRTIQGGAEGGLAGFVNSIGEEDAQKTMKTTIPMGIGAGAVGGYLQGKSAINDAGVLKAADASDDIVKQTEEANKVAGRIGQGDIDDQKKVVEGVKSIRKRGGTDSIKSIKTYKQLDNAIKKTEKEIINEEDDLLKQFPEKIKDWKTTQTVKGLGDQTDEVTRDYLDEGIELLKKYNKNDPAALKELEMLQNIKNTEGLTRLEAKQLARKLSSKLSKNFYNSNDELRNSMSAESYEAIRKGIQNAVRDRLPNDALKNLDLEYSNLKAFEGLADDMTEKVNTLTQKLKDVGPIEKFGRTVGDTINFVTGKGVKGVVEKFLPSNMGNKINNSIDMELELSKNLTKLLKLNDSIDALNNVLSSNASQSALKSAFNKFATAVTNLQSSITPAVTIAGSEALK